LASTNTSLARLQSIGKSAEQKDIWLLTLSQGDPDQKPGLLIVAGVDGTHLAGSEIAVQIAEGFLSASKSDSIAKLLQSKTLYIIPSVNPDAQRQWLSTPKYGRSVNGLAYDNDRD